MVTHTSITSHLNSCNTLYTGLLFNSIWKLQLVQNAATQNAFGNSHYTHIPQLHEFHCLPLGAIQWASYHL